MKRLSLLLAGMLALAISSSSPAADAGGGGSYLVRNFDVLPGRSAQANALTRQYAAAARNEPGAVAVEAYQEIDRPGRYLLIEHWRDKETADAHGKALADFRQKLSPMLMSDFANRAHTAFAVAPTPAEPSRGAVTIVTHLDVFPVGTQKELAFLTAQAEAARQDPGNIRYDVLRWEGHGNHFTLIEVWRDEKARLAATAIQHDREFRTRTTPLEGAPYDDRGYRRLE